MKKLLVSIFILSLVAMPSATHAGFFDFFKINQKAQVTSAVKADSLIMQLQQSLTTLGLYSGKVDGLVGFRTTTAIKAFQRQNKLPVTGLLDRTTVDMILQRGGGSGGGVFQTACNSNTAPRIRVNSPNGGETYQAGQTINVTWSSCNVPSTAEMVIQLFVYEPDGSGPLAGFGLFTNTPNNGVKSVQLPEQVSWSSMQYGTRFKVSVSSNNYGIDYSNNLFTINAGGGNNQITSACNAKVLYPHPGQTYTLAENSTPSGNLIEVYGFVLVTSDPANCVWDTAGSLIPTVSNPPSGAGGSVTIVEDGGQVQSPLFITGNYNFANPTIGNRLYSQSVYFDQQTHPAGQYTLQFTDMDNQNPILIPINIQY